MSLTSLVLSFLISSAAIWLTAELLPGFTVRGFKGALIVAAVLGVLQVVMGWLLYLVIGLATLGLGFLLGFLTRVLVTALLLMLTDKLATSLKIKDFPNALLGALIISAITTLADKLL
jgi:putative membrane protein